MCGCYSQSHLNLKITSSSSSFSGNALIFSIRVLLSDPALRAGLKRAMDDGPIAFDSTVLMQISGGAHRVWWLIGKCCSISHQCFQLEPVHTSHTCTNQRIDTMSTQSRSVVCSLVCLKILLSTQREQRRCLVGQKCFLSCTLLLLRRCLNIARRNFHQKCSMKINDFT